MTQFNTTLTAAPRKTAEPILARLMKPVTALMQRGEARRSRLQAEYAEMIEAFQDKN